jgi:bifunctional ADP-heptose synthase (sugar kinase/adenylyltransferase)
MKVVITFSTFYLLLAGLVKMLEEAKLQSDYLIVGLLKEIWGMQRIM